MSGPLAGTRVVDLARLLPGGYAACLLADLGADVIKVEQPGVGDGLRTAGPYDEDGVSGAHTALNRGKRSVTLDLRRVEGRDLLLELLARSDVLIESFRPGVMTRLGLGRDVLVATNARLVHVAISFAGQDAVDGQKAGHDINAQALAGLLPLAEGPAGGPSLPYLQAADHTVGLQAALAAVAGLHERDRGGLGAFVDLAMTDAAYSLLGLAAAGFSATGQPPTAHEALTGGLACYGLYACADREYVAVGALEPAFFGRLLAALGLPADLADRQYEPLAQAAIRASISEVFAGRPRPEWLARLADVDCCVTPVRDVAEALADPAAHARGSVVVDGVRHARVGPVPLFPGADPGEVARRRAPALGGDTESVLSELGRDAAAVEVLRSVGVV